jgi:hypothetical protein
MSGRMIRNVLCGLALVATCTLVMPPSAQAADLRGAGGSLVLGWSWDWLGSLWSEVGSALNSFFGAGDEETPAPVTRTWEKQGAGADPNGLFGGGPSEMIVPLCDPVQQDLCIPIAVQ